MRKGIKVLAAIVAAATASTMSLSVFAAPRYTSTTELADGVYTTTTQVTGAGTDEVAYLVTAAGAVTVDEDTIVYIDQEQAINGNADFTFTFNADEVEKFKNADIKVGTTSTAASAVTPGTDGVDNKVVIEDLDIEVTYSVDGAGGKVLAVTDAVTEVAPEDLLANGSATASNQLSFVVAPDMGYKLDTVNGAPAAQLDANGLYTVTVSESAKNFVFKFAEDTTAGTPTITTSNVGGSVTTSTDKNSALAFAKASLNIKGAGMYFAANKDALGTNNEEALKAGNLPVGVAHVAALKVGSDGAYAIRLSETFNAEYTSDKAFIGNTMYARAYVEGADGVRTLGDIVTLNVAQ